MQTLTGFARKYAIMEELDSGFSSGSTPEAFVRLDSWDGRIQASVHVKGLKQGPFNYMLYLIFEKNDRLIPILAGPLNVSYNGMQNGLEIDAEVLAQKGVKPESVRFAAITAESRDKKWIPLFSSFEKSHKWDENIRQILLTGSIKDKPTSEPEKDKIVKTSLEVPKASAVANEESTGPGVDTGNLLITPAAFMPKEEKKTEELKAKTEAPVISGEELKSEGRELQEAQRTANVEKHDESNLQEQFKPQAVSHAPQEDKSASVFSNTSYVSRDDLYKELLNKKDSRNKCDIDKLEGLMRNNFEMFMPFKRSSRGYTWYKVSDLAMLSNIMYQAGINVPIFANPKILVGLFKFKHILAGLYRGDDGANYYVIGVPAKNENDNRPFESACRWVPLPDSTTRDMGGYWLVYVSMKTGEIVV